MFSEVELIVAAFFVLPFVGSALGTYLVMRLKNNWSAK